MVATRARAGIIVAVVVALLVAFPLASGAGAAGRSTAQADDETTTTDLLIEGDGTGDGTDGDGEADGDDDAGSDSEGAPATSDDGGLADSTQLWLIVGGLVAVAVLLTTFTVIYWRRTRPGPAQPPVWRRDASPIDDEATRVG